MITEILLSLLSFSPVTAVLEHEIGQWRPVLAPTYCQIIADYFPEESDQHRVYISVLQHRASTEDDLILPPATSDTDRYVMIQVGTPITSDYEPASILWWRDKDIVHTAERLASSRDEMPAFIFSDQQALDLIETARSEALSIGFAFGGHETRLLLSLHDVDAAMAIFETCVGQPANNELFRDQLHDQEMEESRYGKS